MRLMTFAAHRRDGFVRGSDHWLQSALRSGHRPVGPTRACLAQCDGASDRSEFTEAFPWTEAPRYLIRDRDAIYGATVTRRLRAMGIRDKPIAPGSPWQNSFAERLIGSIRRECVDHVIALGEQHLRRVLKSYAIYYNSARTHRSLDKDSPVSRPVQRVGRIVLHDWSAGFITSTSESNFSVRTRAPRARSLCRR